MRKLIFLLFLGLLILFESCSDELDIENQNIEKRSVESEENKKKVFSVNDQIFTSEGKDVQWTQTILGEIRQNPYTVASMLQAHINLYGSLPSNITTTDLYVKFMPTSLDEMALLVDTEEFFYDYPLEYDVIEMGDYYQEIVEGVYPTLYAIVDPSFVFPNVGYEIISNLYMDRSDPLLVAESYRITENKDDIYRSIPKSEGIDPSEIDEDKLEFFPLPPDCPPGSSPILKIDVNTIPLSFNWICVEDVPPPPPTLNDCGCPISDHNRKPGGCVQVEDTELSPAFRGVRRVKVIAKDTWFTEDETWTDDNGCWSINDRYKGRAWFWIRFTNDRCKIRGTASNWKAAWQWITTVKDFVGMKWGPTFNNITVKYEMYQSQGSQAHRYWGAATVNNAMHEFHDYAGFDGVNAPPNKLDIYIGRNNRYGYAMMSAQDFFAQATAVALAAATWWTGPFSPLIALVGWGVTKAYLPDVYIGMNYTNSDQLKRLAYHELAHSSHYTKAGDVFWGSLVAAEVFANGHGDENSGNAGIIAISESWAEHLGLTYADQTYGANASIAGTYGGRLEGRRNEVLNHIPIGLYNDLIDNNPDTNNACDADFNSCGPINDQVTGLTNAILFNLMDGATTSPQIFINRLNSGSSTALQNQINGLFASY